MIYFLLEQSPSDISILERINAITEHSSALLVACRRRFSLHHPAALHLINCGALPPSGALLRFAATRGASRDVAVLIHNPAALSNDWVAWLETHLEPGTDAAIPLPPNHTVLRKHLDALRGGKPFSPMELLPLFPAFAAFPGLAYRVSLLRSVMEVDPFMARRDGVFGLLEFALHLRRFNPNWARVSLAGDSAYKPSAYTVGGWVRWGEVLLEAALEPDLGLYEGAVLRALMDSPGSLSKEALISSARSQLASDRLLSCRPRIHRGLQRAIRNLARRQAVAATRDGYFLTPAMTGL